MGSMVDAAEFRRTLGHFPAGVTIVAAFDGQARPTGLTASAFTSVSLDPPLVLVCVHQKSQSYEALRDSGCFAVNILRADQGHLSREFSAARPDRFDGEGYRRGDELNVPLIEGALASLECTTTASHVEGDHTIFIGRVERAHVGAETPLVHFRGRYGRLKDEPA